MDEKMLTVEQVERPEDKVAPQIIEPMQVTFVGTGTGDGGLPPGSKQLIETPGSQPNYVVNFVSPVVAILVRFINAYLTILVGLVAAGMTSTIIPYTDFLQLVLTCAKLSIAGAGLGLLKDLLTVFGRLEGKWPLLTGSV